MMEMAGGFVRYGTFMPPLATAPPVDGQSSNQGEAVKVSRKRKGKKRMEVTASTSHEPRAEQEEGQIYKHGIGSSFLKMFLGNVAETLFLPRGYVLEAECVAQHWLNISAPSGACYKVWVESYLDTLVFRDGWSDLVANEGVSQGDVGLFSRHGAVDFSLTVFGRGGLEKEARAPNTFAPTALKETKWEDVRFIATSGIRRSAALASTLFSVWVNSRHPLILYAATMKPHAAKGGPMNLNRKVSTKLPAGPTDIGLKFNGSRIIFKGSIVKRSDQIARIQGGWSDFALAHKLRTGKAYVFKFSIDYNGWEVTLYQV